MPEYSSLPALTWTGVLDILIVAFLIYQVLVFIRGTRTVQMVLGLLLVVAFFYFSRWARLETVSWLLAYILPSFAFAIIVIFQSEIRQANSTCPGCPLTNRKRRGGNGERHRQESCSEGERR